MSDFFLLHQNLPPYFHLSFIVVNVFVWISTCGRCVNLKKLCLYNVPHQGSTTQMRIQWIRYSSRIILKKKSTVKSVLFPCQFACGPVCCGILTGNGFTRIQITQTIIYVGRVWWHSSRFPVAKSVQMCK